MRLKGFIGPSYVARSINIDCERCVNLYPEKTESGNGREGEVASLIGTPGLKLFGTTATGPIRGMYTASNGVLYVAAGTELCSVDSSGLCTVLGTLLSAVGAISMVDNTLDLFVVDGVNGYTVSLTSSAFAVVADPDFHGADVVVFQDGYFVFNWPDTPKFFISDLYATTFSGLDFATAEGKPDNIVAVISDHRELWLLGERSTEVWFNSGDLSFPFAPIPGAFVEQGCLAVNSVVRMDNTLFWLSQSDRGSAMVVRTEGYTPKRISTHAIEFALAKLSPTALANAVAFAYQQEGHLFYVLSLEEGGTTWVYDASTKLWHERTYTNSDGQQERHRANSHAFAFGKTLVGDYQNGKMYELDLNTYTDNGAVITRQRTTTHISSGDNRNFFSRFQLDLEAGVGLNGSGQGSDPQVMMRFSSDFAHTWSNERWVSAGKIGQYTRRAIWRRLGQGRDRVYEIKITDPVKTILLGAEIDVKAGDS